MRSRPGRAPGLGKDPATAAEAGQTIHALATTLGWTANRKSHHRPFGGEKTAKCIICGDSFLGYELQRLRCGHRHCRDCLRQNFQHVINDPTAYPAKCCNHLPLAETSFVLSDEEIKAILELQASYESSKIIPCFSCQGDIHLSDIGRDAAYCLKCDNLTCTNCRKEMHNDLCPDDPETENLRGLAKEEGWTQCPKCSRLILRTAGCNSMTCLCKTNFCFRCGCVYTKCICNTIPREASDTYTANKSKAVIAFGTAFDKGSASRKAGFKPYLNYRILRDHRILALNNQKDQTLKLKDLRLKRQLKVKEDNIAKEIIRLRARMAELAVIERVERVERLKAARRGELVVGDNTTKVIITRRNIYTTDGIVRGNDDRPVSKRTRSHC
ncbi:hypothetical protein TWF730_010222 [Orbilia blumenaviensis]|uniref:RING-type domain-containing protein n=1 Tax=Orbilia blumenaviensis TaxID=1796055 RepID=A0AAV9UNV7_9PEZI